MIDFQTTRTGRAEEQGLYVAAVARNNEFHIGDRIMGVNDRRVTSTGQVQDIIGDCHVGDVVNVTVMRGKELVDISVTLTESDLPANPPNYVA